MLSMFFLQITRRARKFWSPPPLKISNKNLIKPYQGNGILWAGRLYCVCFLCTPLCDYKKPQKSRKSLQLTCNAQKNQKRFHFHLSAGALFNLCWGHVIIALFGIASGKEIASAALKNLAAHDSAWCGGGSRFSTFFFCACRIYLGISRR